MTLIEVYARYWDLYQAALRVDRPTAYAINVMETHGVVSVDQAMVSLGNIIRAV